MPEGLGFWLLETSLKTPPGTTPSLQNRFNGRINRRILSVCQEKNEPSAGPFRRVLL